MIKSCLELQKKLLKVTKKYTRQILDSLSHFTLLQMGFASSFFVTNYLVRHLLL